MHCPKCGSIIKDNSETCKFCKENIPESNRKKEIVLRSSLKPVIKTVQSRQIRENKATCQACGNIWFYGKQDQVSNCGSSMQNCGKSMMCCSGCAPALLIPDQKVTDLNQCPKCGSRAVKQEIVTHNV